MRSECRIGGKEKNVANCDEDVVRRFEKLCRMTDAMFKEMTRNERMVTLYLHMLEAGGTVRDHHLISDLVDQVTQRATNRLRGKHPDFV